MTQRRQPVKPTPPQKTEQEKQIEAEKVAKIFEAKLQAILDEFKAETGYEAIQTAALHPAVMAALREMLVSMPPMARVVLETVGITIHDVQVNVGWTFTPIAQLEKPTTPAE